MGKPIFRACNSPCMLIKEYVRHAAVLVLKSLYTCSCTRCFRFRTVRLIQFICACTWFIILSTCFSNMCTGILTPEYYIYHWISWDLWTIEFSLYNSVLFCNNYCSFCVCVFRLNLEDWPPCSICTLVGWRINNSVNNTKYSLLQPTCMSTTPESAAYDIWHHLITFNQTHSLSFNSRKLPSAIFNLFIYLFI